MKKLTIKEKMEIAEKLKNKPNLGYKKIAHTFNITVFQARTIKNNMHILTSNDDHLRGENRRIHSSDKYDSFYGELMGKLKDYRKEGFPTAFKDVKTIAQFIKDSNEKYTNINITE